MEFRRLDAADAEAFRLIRLHGLQESPQAFSADLESNATLPLEHFAARLKNESDAFHQSTMV